MEYTYILSNLEPNFYSRPEVFFTIDALGFIIPLVKRFVNAISDLEPRNCIALLVYPNLRNKIFVIRYYILDSKNTTSIVESYISFYYERFGVYQLYYSLVLLF